MSGHTTRRGFLRKAAVAGGCLVTQGLSGAARTAQPAELADDSPRIAMNAPVIVVTQAVSRDVDPRAGTWVYITEILRRAGLFFEQLSPSRLPSLKRHSNPVVVLAGDLQLTSEEREVLTRSVENGGSLVGIGGTSGLDKVFGVAGERPLAEGWMKVTA
ncbi:MAG: twin-arginine translocation signal domain-containing protein, partial [Planctomycetota bacterium]